MEDLAFLIVDLTFQGQCDLFQVQYQLRSSGGFACLGSHPGLANCTGASIESVKVQGAQVVLASCACFLTHFSPDLYSRQGVLVVCPICAQISTAKAAAQELQLWDSYQLSLCQMVLNRDCAVQKSEAVKL